MPRFLSRRAGADVFSLTQGVKIMFAILAILLVIAWALALFAFHVTAFFIHIALVLAVALFIVHLVTGRNRSA
jgi:hypothetical protein